MSALFPDRETLIRRARKALADADLALEEARDVRREAQKKLEALEEEDDAAENEVSP